MNTSSTFAIGRHHIGAGEPCFIIAEAGSNHDRDLPRAKQLVDTAVAAGADAVKFQTFTAETIAAKGGAAIDVAGARTLFDLYRQMELPREWQRELADYCRARGIVFLSTPFDAAAVDELDALGVPAFKIASFECIDLPLLRHAAGKGRPIVLSTGLASLGEIEEALEAIAGAGDPPVALLHCAVKYPAQPASANLAVMDTLRRAFRVPVGYSDHTLGVSVPIAAAALGATVIEKHFTVDKTLPGPDHSFALDPAELAAMVRGIREAEAALGSPVKRPAPEEAAAKQYRRSIFAIADIPAGTLIRCEHVAVLRPGGGLMPRFLEVVIGRRARRDLRAHDPITWEDV